MYKFGELLKKAMADQNIGVTELSRKSDVSWGLIYGYLSGRIMPTVNNLQRLCLTLHIDGNDALNLTPNAEPVEAIDYGLICRNYCKYYEIRQYPASECKDCKIKTRIVRRKQ